MKWKLIVSLALRIVTAILSFFVSYNREKIEEGWKEYNKCEGWLVRIARAVVSSIDEKCGEKKELLKQAATIVDLASYTAWVFGIAGALLTVWAIVDWIKK